MVIGIKVTKAPYEKIINRKIAIEKAMEILNEEDLLIIAGKGHENYQIIGNVKVEFDDREIIKGFRSTSSIRLEEVEQSNLA